MHVSKGMISFESSFTLILFRLGFETFTGDCCRSFATSIEDKTVVEDIVDNFLGIDQGLYNTGWFKKQFSPCWLEPR